MNVLIFTGGQKPTKKNFKKLIASISKIDYVIAADSGFDAALSYGINCDLLVGDMDSIVNNEAALALSKEKVKAFPKDKDFTDTELALFEAKKMGATSIVLVGGDGGRLDHTLALLKVFEGMYYPNIWLCKEQVVYLLDENTHSTQMFNLTERDTVSVFAIGNNGYVTSSGLEWNLDSVDWKNSAYSVSNRICKSYSEQNRKTEINVKNGRFLVIIPYTAI